MTTQNKQLNVSPVNRNPLKNKFTGKEVKNAVRKMKNQKAAGDDMISAELLKYAPDEIYDNIAAEYNNVLENHKNDIDFGLSILLPTQKSKK